MSKAGLTPVRTPNFDAAYRTEGPVSASLPDGKPIQSYLCEFGEQAGSQSFGIVFELADVTNTPLGTQNDMCGSPGFAFPPAVQSAAAQLTSRLSAQLAYCSISGGTHAAVTAEGEGVTPWIARILVAFPPGTSPVVVPGLDQGDSMTVLLVNLLLSTHFTGPHHGLYR